ncbi:MAG: RloB domain-containing protein [Lachnospiraceae bacterium]|nr:RloB domain-containing protein [Lachnospiraceae bacterium]
MSRKPRTTQKIFKVFCEGSTEYHYIDEMRRQKNLSITLKLTNMEGGGYSRFLEQIEIDGTTNCLAKFIIIDGDRAVKEEGEKKNLQKLIDFCKRQNKYGKIPHFLIVTYPDFEYIACLHMPKYKGQDAAHYLTKELGYQSIDAFKADAKVYHILNTNGNSYEQMLPLLKKENCLVINKYSISEKQYEIKIPTTTCNWDNVDRKGSNINEFFEVIKRFYT